MVLDEQNSFVDYLCSTRNLKTTEIKIVNRANDSFQLYRFILNIFYFKSLVEEYFILTLFIAQFINKHVVFMILITDWHMILALHTLSVFLQEK